MELTRKLQMKPGESVATIDKPGGLVLGVGEASGRSAADAGVVIGFLVRSTDIDRMEPVLVAARDDRLAWLAYPKAGQLGTDLDRDRLAVLATDRGVRPVRQIAIDETWSALRLRPATNDANR